MKIAIVAGPDGRASRTGEPLGDAQYGRQLAAALSRRGHQVVLYRRHEGRQLESDGYGSYPVVSLRAGPARVLAERETFPFIGDFAAELACAWRVCRPDVVHAHSWPTGLAAAVAADGESLPTVQSFHARADMTDDHSPDTRLTTALARNVTWLLAGSHEEEATLIRVRNGRDRITVVPPGIDTRQFRPSPVGHESRTDCTIVGVASSRFGDHGFDDVVRLLPRLPRTA